MPRFAVANNARRFHPKAPQILGVATNGGKHLHRAAMINGKETLTACGEFVTGRYSAKHEAQIVAAVGGATLLDAVTCRHCACISKDESDRRKDAWKASGAY